MTEINESCKNLCFVKPDTVFGQQSSTKSICSSKGYLCNSTHDSFGTTADNILDMVTKLFMDAQKPKLNHFLSTYQTEPLDLSQKQQDDDKQLEISSLPKRLWKPKSFEFNKFFSTHIKRFTANDVCNARCEMLYKDHYHCFAENGICTYVMKGKDQLRQHGKRHSIAEELTKVEFTFCLGCSYQENLGHYHCSHDNCDYVSNHISNMDRLIHVETTHSIILSKRSNKRDNVLQHHVSTKRRKKIQINEQKLKQCSKVNVDTPHSPISNISSDNQLIDFNPDSLINTIHKNNCLTILDRLSPERNKIQNKKVSDEIEASLLLQINEHESNFYPNGNCLRLFCNLKKGDHYHCPICDRGSSKKDLYIRHLKQRHR